MPDPIPATVTPGNVAPAAVQPTPVQPTPAAKPVTPAVTPAAPAQPAVPVGMVPLPALQEERNKRQALETELATLRQQQTAQPVQPPVQQPQQDVRAHIEKLWETDPRQAVQTEILYAMEWRDQIDANLNKQADQIALRDPGFNTYRSAAMNYVRSLPLNQRGNPGILEAAYWMTRGQNVDTLWQQKENELLDRYRRGEFTAAQLAQPAGTFSAPVQPGGVQLTVDQMKVAEAMGMTAEGYASQIKLTAPRAGA